MSPSSTKRKLVIVNPDNGYSGSRGEPVIHGARALEVSPCTRLRAGYFSRQAGDAFVIIASGVASEAICSRIARSVCDAINVPFFFLMDQPKLAPALASR